MASKLIKDLNSVGNIIGGLGLSIAAAQRALNLDYLESIERLAAIAIALQHGERPGSTPTKAALTPEDRKFVQEFLTKFAPARYQYTQTTFTVRLDLAQSLNVSAGLGIGVAVGAIAVNGSFALGYASEYQAAAECKTVLDAIPPDRDPALVQQVSERAATANAEKLTLPARAEVDQQIVAKSRDIVGKLLGFTPAEVGEGT
jgi:hypothetical protein